MKSPLLRLLSAFIISVSFALPSYAQQFETKTINAEPMVKKINRTGKLTFKRTLNLSFKSSGYLEKLNVDEGDSFTAGQLLAQLDTEELIADKNAHYARLMQAKREVKRVNTLLSKNLGSQQALDDAKTLVETTQASYKVAEYNLAKAELIAPFDGVVINRFSELGELQSPSQSALNIAAIEDNLVVRVALTATEISLIKLAQSIDINLAPLGRVTGTVSKIPAIADQQSHLFNIEISLSNVKEQQVVVGQLAHVETDVITDTFVYKLPIKALNSVDNQDRALIMILDNNSADTQSYHQQAFTIEQLSNEYIYLSAQANAKPLTIITKGWQHLTLASKQLEQEQ